MRCAAFIFASTICFSLLFGQQHLRAQAPAPDTAATPPQTLPDAPSTVQETEAERKARLHAEGEHEVKVEEKQRILAVVPNFNTVISGEGVALSPGQKTRLALKATFDPFNLVGALFLAGVSEVADTHQGYGWGPGGFAKRTAANFTDVADGAMLGGAVYPILLRQDPRYFRKGTGSFRSRLGHAVASTFICRGDNGKSQPNYSNVLGNFSAGLISNAYYPSQETGIRLSLVNSTVVTLEGAAGAIGLEFAPDVQAWLHRRKTAEAR